MASTTLPGVLLTGDHASRPAATTVAAGAKYACSDHTKIYSSDGSAWTDWFAAADAAGGSGALTLIETVTVTGSDATITFDSIPNTYNDLIITGRVRDDAAAVVTATPELRCGNSSVDTGSNYGYSHVEFRAGSADAFSNSAADSKMVWARSIVANSATAGLYSPVRIEVLDYADTATFRHFLFQHGSANATDQRLMLGEGWWANTASAIDIITIYGPSLGNLKVGSKLRLYGRL
jgi:hypothetical protein